MPRGALIILATALLAFGAPVLARAQAHVTVEDTHLAIRLDHRSFNLVAHVFRPDGKGPFPLVVIEHGAPSSDEARIHATLDSLDRSARWFAEHGFIVVSALRPGFGASDGPFMERTSPCAHRDYVYDGRETAGVEAAMVESAKALPGVDANRVVVVGHSAGAFGAMALADSPPSGVIAVINFAGGKGGNGDGTVCSGVARLAEAGKVFGRANRLPQLWLYAPNDHIFPPSVARPLYDAYRGGSKPPVEFAELPPAIAEGHNIFVFADPSAWAAPVEAYLRKIGLVQP